MGMEQRQCWSVISRTNSMCEVREMRVEPGAGVFLILSTHAYGKPVCYGKLLPQSPFSGTHTIQTR